MLLWGTAGCGKTHLANTSPGKRLILNFDPDGTASLPVSDDTLLLDYSTEHNRIVSEVKSSNPFNLDTILREHPDIQTLIVDSMTAFTSKTVDHAVDTVKGATFENPSIQGYQVRNRYALGLCKSLLLITARYNRNVIFICHEDNEKNTDGAVMLITVMLGGSLREEVPLHISEVWHLQDKVTSRVAQVRSSGMYKPMKSRMFDTSNGYEFETSTSKDPSKVTLAALFERWRDAKYNKIPLPK
jgi:hypothetical protein